MTPNGRRLDLDGVWNFRDLGGYAGDSGRAVVWNRIYRADGLDRLTESDLGRVSELGLRTVIDLRTTDEVARGRVHPSAGHTDWHHLPMLDALPPDRDYEQWVVADYVSEQYIAMLEGAPGSVAAFLRVLCDPGAYPVVYHCFAGKDRTGILTALVLGLLGVSDTDIAADYAESRHAMTRLLEWLRADLGERPDGLAAAAPAIAAADPETMTAFLAKVRDRYGTFDRYTTHLGLDDAAARLKEILLDG